MRTVTAIGIGLVVLTGSAVLIAKQPVRSAPSGHSRPAEKQDSLTKPQGMHVIIGLVDDDNREQLICMVRDPKDRAEIEQHVANHNVEGMRQALGYRRATLIPNRTPALLLETGPELCKVRLLAGEVRGREGWLPHEYLLREAY